MLPQPQIAALLIKVAVSASIASILMRFGRMQRILLRDERTVSERLQLALIFSLIFGGTAAIRLLSHHQYKAIDLAFEGSILAGMLGGYVSGLITGICTSVPDMVAGKFMSMPLYAAVGLMGALMHDLAPEREDVWYFSPFADLNLYRLFRQILRWNRSAIQRRVLERAAFNLSCYAMVIVAELLRWGIHSIFDRHNTFLLLDADRPGIGLFAASAITSLFAVSLPIRVWSSFRAEKQLEMERARLTEARLAALTNQINPHFLFNTLNSVSTLIRIDPARARNMIYKLSSILRRLLRKTESLSPLRDEVSFIDDYLAIEMVRFGDKLRFEKEIEEAALDRLLPSMILQPIVENSIKHGLANKVEGGTVKLRAWLEGSRLNVVIEDNGAGIEDSKLDTIYERGIGISNVNERLRVLYGSRFRMQVTSQLDRGTATHIDVPELEGEFVEAMRKVSA
ncbi:MAG TPA: histidine kinase [Bryobacteraceae bacterium]|jgi:two-component system LytT family sensor kinase|nr:histidine kinase [Bryobacteraceae bacterium]